MSSYNCVYDISNDMHGNISASFECTQFNDYNVQNKNDRTIQDIAIKCNLHRAFIFSRPKNTYPDISRFVRDTRLVSKTFG